MQRKFGATRFIEFDEPWLDLRVVVLLLQECFRHAKAIAWGAGASAREQPADPHAVQPARRLAVPPRRLCASSTR